MTFWTRRRAPARLRRLALGAAFACGASLLLCLGGAAPAQAQIQQGTYRLSGTNPDGSTYEGEFALQPGPGASWIAAWQVGDARIFGLAVIQGGVLAVSFVVEGRPGVAAFDVEPDGSLRGIWTTGGGLGTETLRRQ